MTFKSLEHVDNLLMSSWELVIKFHQCRQPIRNCIKLYCWPENYLLEQIQDGLFGHLHL